MKDAECCNAPHYAKGLCYGCYWKKYQLEHQEELKNWRKRNSERLKIYNRIYSAKWRREHPERKREINRASYHRHKNDS